MPQFHGAADIYKELVEDSEDNWLFGLVAFALVEEQRVEWMRHYEEANSVLPDPKTIENWYRNQPASVLLKAKGTAENALTNYSEEVLETYLEEHKRSVEEGILLEEIRGLKAFWPQFGISLVGGLASTLLFAAVLAVLAFVVLIDASPVDIVNELNYQTKGN